MTNQTCGGTGFITVTDEVSQMNYRCKGCPECPCKTCGGTERKPRAIHLALLPEPCPDCKPSEPDKSPGVDVGKLVKLLIQFMPYASDVSDYMKAMDTIRRLATERDEAVTNAAENWALVQLIEQRAEKAEREVERLKGEFRGCLNNGVVLNEDESALMLSVVISRKLRDDIKGGADTP